MRTLALCSALLALSALAQAPPPAAPAQTPPAEPVAAQNVAGAGMPRDENVALVTNDLHALSRIAALSANLEESRQLMLAIIDSDVELLRDRRPDDTYRWASLQRLEASRVQDQKTIERVQTEKELREVTLTAPSVYRVEVSVPEKRNLVSGNNRVFVRNILVDSTGFDGKTVHTEIPVNAWVNPGDATGVPLPEIGRSVKATAELGVESGNKRAVANLALIQARLVDDPTSPYFPAVRRLLQIRDFAAAKEINRGQLKNTVDEGLIAMPGELERRTAAQTAAEERRRQLAATGQMANAIAVGDATPDVVAAMQEVTRLLGGTLQDQTAARTRLQSLIESLQPKPATAPGLPPASTPPTPPPSGRP